LASWTPSPATTSTKTALMKIRSMVKKNLDDDTSKAD
jgi:hypothetical protein